MYGKLQQIKAKWHDGRHGADGADAGGPRQPIIDLFLQNKISRSQQPQNLLGVLVVQLETWHLLIV